MARRLALAVIELSDSFRTAWSELAEELGTDLVQLSPDAVPGPDTAAVLIAAGGEEDRAISLLSSVQRVQNIPLYLVGAQPSHRFGVEAVRRGATDYFVLPGDLDLLRRTLASRVEAARERTRPSGPVHAPADAFVELLGNSEALLGVVEAARRLLPHRDVTVLIQGDTGTGKELLARALHDGGPRASGPFVALNCAAIPRELMESELFGHERGAFTDAHTTKPGLFEEAHRGSMFLDEVGHLPLPLQGKLLRTLEERRIRRVGATQSREVDVRIIAATNVDLGQAVRTGEFREDLFYRLNVVNLTLPPLSQRGNDVEVLAKAFAASLAERYSLPTPELTPEVLAAVRAHPWPGNVRELHHAIERALLLSEPGTLDPAHFTSRATATTPSANAIPFPATLSEILAAAARVTLEQVGGNKSEAARRLGISRARLQRLLQLEEDRA